MSDSNLGEILNTEVLRDAIHIAIAPVIAGETLKPGQHVGFSDNTKTTVVGSGFLTTHIGIVDPFLKAPVVKGQRFYICLYPRTVTGIKHIWSHPEFDDSTSGIMIVNNKDVSFKWIEQFATEAGITFRELMEAAKAYKEDENEGGYLGFDTPEILYNEYKLEEFWKHFEVYTETKLPETLKKRQGFFRCAC